jgi:hypothetical protein
MVTYVGTSQVIDRLGQPGKSARQLDRLARPSERTSPRRSPNVALRNRQSSSEKLEEGVSVDKEAICIIG